MHKYRPDIDGLRAIAVLAVIAYHAFPHRLLGGFIGVDVFFVISGYLISGILIESSDNGGIDFGTFYRRRINRIFPSLVVVLFACLSFGWIALFPKEFHQLGADVASGATFSANFSLLGEAGYFDRSAAAKPLLHLWSLAIEEQFYIIWPLLLWAVARTGKRWTVWLGTFSIISFCCNLVIAAQNPIADFYLPLTRFWELSLGGVLASWQHEHVSTQTPPTLKRMLSLIGAATIGVALCTISSDHYPGVNALLPVLGSIALIAAGMSGWVNRRLLAHPTLRWIGTISYPLYLWHWPLLSYARIVEGETPSIASRLVVITAAFGFAVLTHYFVENPFRFGAYPLRKTAAALTMMVLAAGLGQAAFLQHGFAERSVVKRNPALATADAGGAGPFTAGDCGIPRTDHPHVDGCLRDTRGAPRYALIGDSKAGALAPALFRTSNAGERWMYLGNNDGKGTYMSTTLLSPTKYPREYPLTREILDIIESHSSIHAVVIADAVRNLYNIKDETSLESLPAHPDAALTAAFDSVLSELIAHRRRVYLVVDNPTLAHPEDCIERVTSVTLINRLLDLPTHPHNCTVSYHRFMTLTIPYQNLLAQLVAKHQHQVIIVPTSDIYCNIHDDRCPMFHNGRLLYGYTDHPSDYAAGLVAARINAAIRTNQTRL